jgi:hypothetical protein
VNSTYTPEQVKDAFKVFQGLNPAGHVRAEALVKAIYTYGKEKLAEDQAAELVSQMRADGGGASAVWSCIIIALIFGIRTHRHPLPSFSM